ncbi:adenosylcobalamin-dependent ribonucleoside-diphosphate reductase [Maricaulis sp.]|uniref:adenosylcobalamin-dependent ribonucleoside-diphosphate reductase n=1 Tax=Maricaulis sp. TaxID=1486257 RepID=UPI001B0A7CB5|nr:adenosylcobalamin-dependent ribonucleoside-diphosphate reductase [Maricaulis sp.]MBO6763862.1 adenosylcobalamin-dependent ribonucleoside-diphosphate reductase [Maricaulis sp.]
MFHWPAAISRRVWEDKYRHTDADPAETAPDDSWRRVANALAAAETQDSETWAGRFFGAMSDFRFLPGGRILAGAGTGRDVTLFNCFVMGTLEDSVAGIFRALEESARTMQQGGGIGIDFSPLRPRGMPARRTGNIATGPVSFMRIWDAVCVTILSAGARRGAMMATLRCDHPDIEAFIDAKREPGQLRHFNLSVLITDTFMEAVRTDGDWPLVFPAPGEKAGRGPCHILRRIRARELWARITETAYDTAEPGVLFVDRINRLNNLAYCECITATNPCGEIPLPPYGACALGSINLTRFVQHPFTPRARLDTGAIEATVPVAVRLLDNVLDVSRFPLDAQAEMARQTRRIGLGMTGLADTLLMLGLDYGEDTARQLAAETMRRICHAAYRASIALARDKGPFPRFERDAYLAGGFVSALPADIRDAIAAYGIRNSHLVAIAPTGSISLLAGNVSSGLEPIFAGRVRRRVIGPEGEPVSLDLTDYALAVWRGMVRREDGVPDAFVTATDLPAEAHLDMQAALQPHVDNAISKTVNVPADCTREAFASLYERAFALGLKGCTVFRPNPVTGAVLTREDGPEDQHCCRIEA